MAFIEWTDDLGFFQLNNGLGGTPGYRFSSWKPLVKPIGPMDHALGTGVPAMWEHRSDYGAQFTLKEIPDEFRLNGTVYQFLLARLKRHLLRAGQIEVHTEDTEDRNYSCYLWPGSEPDISGYDPARRRRSITLSVLNSDQAEMICCYP